MADVFYSAGQNVLDHQSGGTVTITGSVAVFSVPQVASKLGVGDQMNYDAGGVAYLAAKNSTTSWDVVGAWGGAIGDTVGAVSLDSIAHAFASLELAIVGAGDAQHLNSFDLTAAGRNVQLWLACYNDSGADTTNPTVNGYTQDATHYITVYTPDNTSTECNERQRHTGKWTPGAYRLELTGTDRLGVTDSFVRVVGLQVLLTLTGAIGSDRQAVRLNGEGIWFTHGVVRGISSAATSVDKRVTGILCDFAGADVDSRIGNNIVYDFEHLSGSSGTSRGIRLGAGAADHWFYNNTVYNCEQGFSYTANRVTLRNNIANGCATCYDSAALVASSTNISSDATSPEVPYRNITLGFVDKDGSPRDLHLAATDAAAIEDGTDLDSDASFPITDDIDGDARDSSSPDIGADERMVGAAGGKVRARFFIPRRAV